MPSCSVAFTGFTEYRKVEALNDIFASEKKQPPKGKMLPAVIRQISVFIPEATSTHNW